MPTDDLYVIWSLQAAAWWGPEAHGYVSHLKDAGRFSRDVAIRLCAGAVLSAPPGSLPELPGG